MDVAVGFVLGACLAIAFACGLELLRISRKMRRVRAERPPLDAERYPDADLLAWEEQIERRVYEDRIAQWLTIVVTVSLGIAATVAVLEGELDAVFHDSFHPHDSSQIEHSDRSETLTAAERAAFDGRITKRYGVPREWNGRRLCLMRYGERGFGGSRLSGGWWTSCRIAQGLSTVIDVKEDLALPARFGAVRDARVRAVIPTGTVVTYYEGSVAPQCEHEEDELPCRGHRYKGGGWQYYFPRPTRIAAWIKGVECTRAREDQASRWSPCAG